MPNSIQLAKKYEPILDAVYKNASASAILDTPSTKLDWTGVDTVNVYETSTQGYVDYTRDVGYGTAATVTGVWRPYQLQVERGIQFSVDAMDNEESLDMALVSTISETQRVELIPEVDAYRFAKYAGLAGTKVAAASTNTVDEIDTALSVMDDAEVTKEGRIIFISNANFKDLKSRCVRTIMNGETGISKEILTYENCVVVPVPTNRFKTTVTLEDGTTKRGFTPGAKNIHFMVIDPKAVIQVQKYANAKLFTPADNQTMDSYLYQSRLYHDAFVLANKTKGIYVHADV